MLRIEFREASVIAQKRPACNISGLFESRWIRRWLEYVFEFSIWLCGFIGMKKRLRRSTKIFKALRIARKSPGPIRRGDWGSSRPRKGKHNWLGVGREVWDKWEAIYDHENIGACVLDVDCMLGSLETIATHWLMELVYSNECYEFWQCSPFFMCEGVFNIWRCGGSDSCGREFVMSAHYSYVE